MAGRKPSDKKRAAILAAAIAEFQECGFDGTSMDRIAKRAHVSKRTVYNHFENKEKLYHAFLGGAFHKPEDCQFCYAPDVPIREQLKAMILLDVERHSDPQHLASARTMVSDVLRNPDLSRILYAEVGQMKKDLTQWFAAAHTAGALELQDPSLAAKELMSMVHGFFFWPQIFLREPTPDDAQRDRIVESILDTFLARYGA